MERDTNISNSLCSEGLTVRETNVGGHFIPSQNGVNTKSYRNEAMLRQDSEEAASSRALPNAKDWHRHDPPATWLWSTHFSLRGLVSLCTHWENVRDKCSEGYQVL